MEKQRRSLSGFGVLLQVAAQPTPPTPNTLARGDENVPGGGGGEKRVEERLKKDVDQPLHQMLQVRMPRKPYEKEKATPL